MPDAIPVKDGGGEERFFITPHGSLRHSSGQLLDLQKRFRNFYRSRGVGLRLCGTFRGLFGEEISHFVIDSGDTVRRIRTSDECPTRVFGSEWWDVIHGTFDQEDRNG